MPRAIVVAALLLMSSQVMAEEPLFCWGKPIQRVTDELKRDKDVVGTTPIQTMRSSCGGNYDEYGSRIAKWDCFVQVWKARVGGEPVFLWTAYSRKNNDWVLATVKVCERFDSTSCTDFPGVIRPCSELHPENSSYFKF